MFKAPVQRLSRQRFFEVKKIMEDYNNDLIGLADFKKRLKPKEAEAFQAMFKQAGFEISKVDFLV